MKSIILKNEHGRLYIIILPCKHPIKPDYDVSNIFRVISICIAVPKAFKIKLVLQFCISNNKKLYSNKA